MPEHIFFGFYSFLAESQFSHLRQKVAAVFRFTISLLSTLLHLKIVESVLFKIFNARINCFFCDFLFFPFLYYYYSTLSKTKLLTNITQFCFDEKCFFALWNIFEIYILNSFFYIIFYCVCLILILFILWASLYISN